MWCWTHLLFIQLKLYLILFISSVGTKRSVDLTGEILLNSDGVLLHNRWWSDNQQHRERFLGPLARIFLPTSISLAMPRPVWDKACFWISPNKSFWYGCFQPSYFDPQSLNTHHFNSTSANLLWWFRQHEREVWEGARCPLSTQVILLDLNAMWQQQIISRVFFRLASVSELWFWKTHPDCSRGQKSPKVRTRSQLRC